MALRKSIQMFNLANNAYVGAGVTFYTVDGSGVKTTTKATLYDAITGTGTLANPQTLDSDGKLAQAVYVDTEVIAAITGLSVSDHETGIIAPAWNARSAWSTATAYNVNDVVDISSSEDTDKADNLYVCAYRHTSGTFATDRDTNSYWVEFIDLSQIKTLATAAAASAAAAQAAAAGFRWKDRCIVATTANIALSGEQTIDGVLTSAYRVLVKNQSATAENGIYVSDAGTWTRSTDADTWDELPSLAVAVEQGTINKETLYICASDSGGTLETTAVTFTQYGAGDLKTSDIGVTVLAPTGDGSGLTGIATGATDAQKANIALNAFRIAVNGGLSVQNMVDGVTDEFEDETGVDTATSTNETYEATNDYYHNPRVVGSDLTTGGSAGTASSDNETTSASSKAFTDGAGTTADADCWVTGTGPTYPVYLRFAFSATKVVNRYRILPQDTLTRAPKNWTVQGRVTAGGWVTLDTQTNITSWATGTWKEFDFVNSTTYDEYQILVSANNGDSYVAIAEVEFILVASPPAMTLLSTAQTALAQPSDVFVVLWHETVDAVTLDTDLKAWASIDGGTTWAQAALSLAASLSGNEQILSGTADVSAQTGTSIKWKIETLNNKEQRLHGVSEQWS